MSAMRKVIRSKSIFYNTSGEFVVGNVLAGHEMKENDPFLFAEDVVFPEGTFGEHPHRGIETITYVIDGEVHHYDRANGSGVIQTGDVQWMTAGRGVLHSEEPKKGTKAHVIQLWLNLPKDEKMRPSRYQTLLHQEMPVVEESGVSTRIFAGHYEGAQAATKTVVDVNMYDVRLQKGVQHTILVEEGRHPFIVLIEGKGIFGSNRIERLAPAVIHYERNGESITIEAEEDMHFLYFDGHPLHEPIAARGPFVMNTDEELREAFRDYREGKFETY